MSEEPLHTIANSNSNPDTLQRRTGGSDNDPHGGHQSPDNEWHGPDPDPTGELVPAGSGALPPSPPAGRHNAGSVAHVIKAADKTGFGPSERDEPLLKGNPEIGIDPGDSRNDHPPLETERVER